MTRKQTAEYFDEIADFSGIGDFMHEPLRTYSAGMIMRLAFSVAITTDPDILLIDEVLVVGDQSFQAKCFERIWSFRKRGKTLLCVSHAVQMIRDLCDHAIWLDHGEVVMRGTASKVIDAYGGQLTPA